MFWLSLHRRWVALQVHRQRLQGQRQPVLLEIRVRHRLKAPRPDYRHPLLACRDHLRKEALNNGR